MRRLTVTALFPLFVGITATSAILSHARPAHADGVDEGRQRFTRGLELYKEGNFHAALAEFRAAYAAAPSFRLQYNLGQTLYQLQDYAGAVRAFDQYLTEGGDKIEPERKKEVEGELAKLRQRVAKLTFVVNVPTAEVSIDDEPRGTAQKPILVSAGRRRISITASNYQTETRVVDLAGAQQTELKFELKPIGGVAGPGPGPAGPESPAKMQPKSRTLFYVGLGVTGALAGGTAVFAILTSGQHSDFEAAVAKPGATKTEIDSARDSTKSMALVADIFAGGTILAAGLTVMAFVLTSGEEPATTAKASPLRVPPPKLTARPVIGPGMLGLSGTF